MDLVRLEQQRLALEANLQQLRKGLKHWQTLDAEYEGLKEEIQGPPPETLNADFLDNVAKTYGGELVDEQEVRILFGLDKGAARSMQQIIDVVERRQEYVGKNLDVIRKRFFEAEAKLEEFDFQAMRSREGSGEGDATDLPLTEIVEELDEEDNIVSSRLEQPEASHGRLIESLRKAGLTDKDLEGGQGVTNHPPLKPAITNASSPITPNLHATKSVSPERSAMHDDDNTSADERPSHSFTRKKSVSFSADTKAAPEFVRLDSEDGKKSVTFAEKVAIAPAASLPDPRSVSFSPNIEEIPAETNSSMSPQVLPTTIDRAQDSKSHTGIEQDLRGTFKPGDKVLELDENDEIKSEHLVLPGNETPEEAQLRREMLEYHLNEVGHVVAEIDLIEGESDGYGDDDDDDDDDDDTSSRYTGSTYQGDEDTPYVSGLSDDDDDDDDDEEDAHGRSKRSYITDDYRKEMQELQMKLIGNLGAQPNEEEIEAAAPDLDPQDVRKLVIREKDALKPSQALDESGEKKISVSKKRVSFAEELDVAEPGSPPLKAQKLSDGENVGPVSSMVAERPTAAAPSLPALAIQEKVSRFKKTRAVPAASNVSPSTNDMTDSLPTFAAGQTLADSLVERPASNKPPPSADDPDPIMQRRELAAAYYQRRNEVIKQQGGFKRDEEEEELLGPLMEERDGKIKKVSRFMAARIKGPE